MGTFAPLFQAYSTGELKVHLNLIFPQGGARRGGSTTAAKLEPFSVDSKKLSPETPDSAKG
jgi:hypothetical protein